MKRKQFTFYRSFSTSVKRVPEEYQRMTYQLICDYALDGIRVDLEQLPDPVASVFSLIQPNLDASRRKAAGGMKGKPGTKKRPVERAVEKSPKAALERREKDTGKKGEKKSKVKNETELETELESKTEIKTESKHKCDAPGAQGLPAERAAFERFWNRYPKKWNQKAAWKAWEAQGFDERQLAAVMEALEAFRESEVWKKQDGRFVPAASRWLEDGLYRNPPVKSFWEGGGWTPGKAELDAIQSVLEE